VTFAPPGAGESITDGIEDAVSARASPLSASVVAVFRVGQRNPVAIYFRKYSEE